MTVRIMPPQWVKAFRDGERNEQGNPFDRETATGRACCRACGQRIGKGEVALVGYYDFTHNYGSWTSVRVWLHIDNCEGTK